MDQIRRKIQHLEKKAEKVKGSCGGGGEVEVGGENGKTGSDRSFQRKR